jgi:hypothetical protein
MDTDLYEQSVERASCEIQWDALKAAFENHSGGAKTVLDRTTGEVLDFDGSMPYGNHATSRFLTIVPVPSRVQYQMMETFIASVTSTQMNSLLHETIVGKGAFRRFKDALAQFPDERKRWFTFRDALLHQYILDWLVDNHVSYVNPPQWNLELPEASSMSLTLNAEAQEAQIQLQNAITEQELETFLLSWAKDHGADFSYTYCPAVFEALCHDLKKSFSFSKRV